MDEQKVEESTERQYCVVMKSGFLLYPTSRMPIKEMMASIMNIGIEQPPALFFEGPTASAIVLLSEVASICSPEAIPEMDSDGDEDDSGSREPSPRESGNLFKPGGKHFSKPQY